MTTTSLPFGELLKTLRSRRKLSQQELAQRLGKHLNTIGSWERGDRLPDTKAMVLELARVLHLEDEETRQLLAASLTALSPYWSVPYQRNLFFTGRRSLLERLHQQLGQQHPIALSQSYALNGLGGIGKSQLALEYAYQHASEYYAVFWIAAETLDTLSASFSAIAELLQLPEARESTQQRLLSAVRRWLATHKEWLLIFDNVEDLGLLKASLPAARQGAVLITTRLHPLEGLAQPLELPAFSRAEALRFLLGRARLVEPAQPLDEVPREVLRTASTLVKAMAGLPLALDQAGAYIERTGCSLEDYLRLFQRYQVHLLAERSLATDHPHSVVQTFLLSFEQLAQRSPAASDLLRLCAVLHPEAIPEELIQQGASHWSPALQQAVGDALAFDRTLAELLRFSLVKRSAEQRALSLHRLVQAVLLEAMAGAEREQWRARAISALNTLLPQPKRSSTQWLQRATLGFDSQFFEAEYAAWSRCERLLPHAVVCLERAGASADPLVLASLASQVGEALYKRGRHGEAELLLQRALHLREQALGPEHLEVASALGDLAMLHWSQGEYAGAELLLQRAVRIQEQALGPDHLDIANDLEHLAIVYIQQRKYAQAEPIYLRSLAMREQVLGPGHTEVASAAASMVIFYAEQGKAEQAARMLQRAVAIREQALAAVLAHMAIFFTQQGEVAQAAFVLQRALPVLEQVLGPEHPDVALALTLLATISEAQGQAAPLLDRAVAIWKRTPWSEHTNVAALLANLAHIFAHQGKDKQAEILFQHAVHLGEVTLGAQHPHLAQSLVDFAVFRETQGNAKAAASLYQRALSMRAQVLGPQDPKTTETRGRLRAVLLALERDQEAAGLDLVHPESAET